MKNCRICNYPIDDGTVCHSIACSRAVAQGQRSFAKGVPIERGAYIPHKAVTDHNGTTYSTGGYKRSFTMDNQNFEPHHLN